MKILLRIVFAFVPEVNLNCRLYSQSEPMSHVSVLHALHGKNALLHIVI